MNPYEPIDLLDILRYLQSGAAYLDAGVRFEQGKYQNEVIAKQFDGDDLTLESVINISMPDKRHVTRHFPGIKVGDTAIVTFIGSYWENRQGVVHSIYEDTKLIRIYFEFAQAYADFEADELFVTS